MKGTEKRTESASECHESSGGDASMKPNRQYLSSNSVFLPSLRLLCSFFLVYWVLLVVGCSSGGAPAPVLPSASSLPASCMAATVGSSYSCQISVTGGTHPITWTASGLPKGLSLVVSQDTTSATISGTPEPLAAIARAAEHHASATGSASSDPTSTASVNVTATDAKGRSSSVAFSISLAFPALAIPSTTLPAGIAGSAYSSSLSASGGVSPYTWKITGLPSGLTPTSGTPTATISGTTNHVGNFTITALVTDSESTPASASVTLRLVMAPAATLVISTPTLSNATPNSSYSQTLVAMGGISPLTWSKTSGNLPAGLMLNSMTGVISGMATSTGTSTFTIQVSDSTLPTPQTDSKSLSITVAQGARLAFTGAALPAASDGAVYSMQSVSATGGIQPYTFTVTGGALPHGMNGAQSGNSFQISGTPNDVAKMYSLTLQVKDSSNPPQSQSATFALSLSAASPVSLEPSSAGLPPAAVNNPYSQTITASGGIPPYSFTITNNTLPATLAVSPGNGPGSGTNAANEKISGTPTDAEIGDAFTIEVADSSFPTPLTHTITYTLDVNALSTCALSGKQFAFEMTGSDTTGTGVMLGSVKIATDGSLTGTLDFRNQTMLLQNQSISGAAGSCKNGTIAETGTLTFTAGGVARTLEFAMPSNFANGATGHVVEKDSSGFSGAGQIQLQDAPTTSLEGSRAFGLEGFNPTTEAFAIGAVCLNSQSSISFLQADFSVNLVEINMVAGNGGTFSTPDSNGRAVTTTAVTYSNGTTLDNTVYVVNGHKAYMMVSSGTAPGLGALPPMAGFLSGVPGSDCLPIGQGSSFSNSSLSPSTFFAHGVSGSGGTVNGTGVFAGAVLSVNAGEGTLTYENDQSAAGKADNSGVKSATYSIPASNNGRGTITTLDSQNRPSIHEFYLDGNGNAYIIFGDHRGQGITFGVVRPRSATTIAPGTYAFGTQLLVLGAPVLSVTEVQITTTTITDLATGGSTGSYSCDVTGRCTASSLSNSVTFGDKSIVFYINGNTDSATTMNEINVIQLSSTTPVGGGLEQ